MPPLARILSAYLSGPASLPDLAKSLALDLSELLTTLTSPAFLALLETARTITAQRAALLHSEKALFTLADLCAPSNSPSTRLRAATAILRHAAAETRPKTAPKSPAPAPFPAEPTRAPAAAGPAQGPPLPPGEVPASSRGVRAPSSTPSTPPPRAAADLDTGRSGREPRRTGFSRNLNPASLLELAGALPRPP